MHCDLYIFCGRGVDTIKLVFGCRQHKYLVESRDQSHYKKLSNSLIQLVVKNNSSFSTHVSLEDHKFINCYKKYLKDIHMQLKDQSHSFR